MHFECENTLSVQCPLTEESYTTVSERKKQVETSLRNTECIQIEVKTISVFRNFLEEEHALCNVEICVKQVFPAMTETKRSRGWVSQ